MNTDEALADARWHIDHGTRPSVETTITLMAEIAELRRKFVNAEICSLTAENKALKHLLRRVFDIVFQNESGLYRIAKLKALLQEDAKEGE